MEERQESEGKGRTGLASQTEATATFDNVTNVFLADFDIDKGNTLRHKIPATTTLSCNDE
jgi:hypothetical protein